MTSHLAYSAVCLKLIVKQGNDHNEIDILANKLIEKKGQVVTFYDTLHFIGYRMSNPGWFINVGLNPVGPHILDYWISR